MKFIEFSFQLFHFNYFHTSLFLSVIPSMLSRQEETDTFEDETLTFKSSLFDRDLLLFLFE